VRFWGGGEPGQEELGRLNPGAHASGILLIVQQPTATLPISIPNDAITSFCEANHIRKLSLFGSVLTDRFQAESDVDVLVEFHTGHVPGLLGLARMERELAAVIGRKADLRTPGDLSRYFRDQVLAGALAVYERS